MGLSKPYHTRQRRGSTEEYLEGLESTSGLLPRVRLQGLVKSMIDEADSGRCKNGTEGRRQADSNESLHGILREGSPEQICETRSLSAFQDALWG